MSPETSGTDNRIKPPPPVIYRICGRPGHNDRPPLPAGHPLSWRLLTDGTSLDGSCYPFPVFAAGNL